MLALVWVLLAGAPEGFASAADYPSIQAALDALPGGAVWVPAGQWPIDGLRLDENSARALAGPGTLVMRDPAKPAIEVEHARDAELRGLTVTRDHPADAAMILCADVAGLRIERLTIPANPAPRPAIDVRDCRDVAVRDCVIRDYQVLSIDDRTGPPGSRQAELYGYAFRCLDGTGIAIRDSVGVLLQRNTIAEKEPRATRAARDEHGLGALVAGAHPPTDGRLGAEARGTGYVRNWHQGAAMLVTGPETTRDVVIADNTIAHAAQGIDLHADRVTCVGNHLDGALIGIKATHGSSDVTIAGNHLAAVDLWGILVAPGSASTPANRDERITIAANTIERFGEGGSYWNWGGARDGAEGSYPIYLDTPQVPEAPPLRDIRILGNRVIAGDPPRHRWSLCIAPQGRDAGGGPLWPEGLVIAGNDLAPGLAGVTNLDLTSLAPGR